MNPAEKLFSMSIGGFHGGRFVPYRCRREECPFRHFFTRRCCLMSEFTSLSCQFGLPQYKVSRNLKYLSSNKLYESKSWLKGRMLECFLHPFSTSVVIQDRERGGHPTLVLLRVVPASACADKIASFGISALGSMNIYRTCPKSSPENCHICWIYISNFTKIPQ